MLPIGPIVTELRFSAAQNVWTCSYHVTRPRKLLTVQNKGLPVFDESSLIVSALPLQTSDPPLLVLYLPIIVVKVPITPPLNFFIIYINMPVIVLNAILEFFNIMS